MNEAEESRQYAGPEDDYAPPLAFLETLRAHFPDLAVKVAPTLDDATLARYDARVEFLSDRGECREAALWFGALTDAMPADGVGGNGPQAACATVLCPGCRPATQPPHACPPPSLSAPRGWLIEPDPAVIRAHRLPELCSLLSAALLAPQIAYLTADTPLLTPFATAYRIREEMPYNLKNIQRWLRTQGGRLIAIKKRGVPFLPEEVRRQLDDAGETPLILVLTRRAGRAVAYLCDPPSERLPDASADAPVTQE